MLRSAVFLLLTIAISLQLGNLDAAADAFDRLECCILFADNSAQVHGSLNYASVCFVPFPVQHFLAPSGPCPSLCTCPLLLGVPRFGSIVVSWQWHCRISCQLSPSSRLRLPSTQEAPSPPITLPSASSIAASLGRLFLSWKLRSRWIRNRPCTPPSSPIWPTFIRWCAH